MNLRRGDLGYVVLDDQGNELDEVYRGRVRSWRYPYNDGLAHGRGRWLWFAQGIRDESFLTRKEAVEEVLRRAALVDFREHYPTPGSPDWDHYLPRDDSNRLPRDFVGGE